MNNRLLLLACIPLLLACEKVFFEDDLQSDDPYDNFDYLWTECDQKYSFFDYKNIDWEAIRGQYRDMLYPEMSDDSLFKVMGAMLRELKDDHVNLISSLNISYYGNYKSGPDNFEWRVIADHYLPQNHYRSGPFRHDFIRGDSIAYIRLPSFTGNANNDNLNFMLKRYQHTKGIIFDIRENGGGSIADIYRILSRFVDQKTLLYSSRIKNGPGHNDFTAPKPVYLSPSEETTYHKKVILLADRSSYSASSFTCLAARAIPNIVFMGDTTGGGLGIPNGGQLPNGWRYRFSVTQTIDNQGNNFEAGVPPEIPALFQWNNLHKDEVIEKAIQEINATS
ncbi:MAG: S41 family peptidase [Bacteroidota bacterium]